MRAVDNQHGDSKDQGLVGMADKGPGHCRDHGGNNREIEQQCSCPIGQCLGSRARLLCLLDEPADSGNSSVITDRGDTDSNS